MDFQRVLSYVPGKVDWMAYGLPVERGPNMPPVVGDLINRDVPRCHAGDSVYAARQAAYEMGVDFCPVVNNEGVLLGLCTRNTLHAHPAITVDLVMEPGPITARPSLPVKEALGILERKKTRTLIVTTPDGKLIGCFDRRAAIAAKPDDGKDLPA
ncbi:MAG TPA: CBS domain-containing protein [Candidatus Binatia bacterium]|jgi:CBS domain-containing protein|nr:CBS domain-containing protein [Candidatus Binatia bacterium]